VSVQFAVGLQQQVGFQHLAGHHLVHHNNRNYYYPTNCTSGKIRWNSREW